MIAATGTNATDVTRRGGLRRSSGFAGIEVARWPDELPGRPSDVPTAVLTLLGDGAIRAFAEPSHRIVRWTTHDRGGHFASLQAPDLLVDDVRAFAADLLAGAYDRGSAARYR
ncbi:MAG: hypothetical protein L0I76_21860 [Pseudonocardia sp.]|nr:hypothetical protein [Pseudonocardia sp.]